MCLWTDGSQKLIASGHHSITSTVMSAVTSIIIDKYVVRYQLGYLVDICQLLKLLCVSSTSLCDITPCVTLNSLSLVQCSLT